MKFQKILPLFCVVFLGLSVSASAAGDGWMTDFEAAKVKAKAENKPMLLDFTGSDWCGWCIKLDKEVFGEAAFKDYAVAELVLVELGVHLQHGNKIQIMPLLISTFVSKTL